MKQLLALSVLSFIGLGRCDEAKEWWQTMSVYQIYPRSFKDSDGDGVGDLKGIASKLSHLSESNVDAFWLSPIYPSPMVDFGYDISDYVNIEPVFGTMQDFDDLVEAAHNASIKVILDLVPNHSSDKHEWFQKSLQRIEPYTNYYVWHPGKVLENGSVTVPNNWVSLFGGSAWTWRDERQAYYLHQFAVQQPDLNYDSEDVRRDIKNVLRFWLDKGVDGFRVDAVPYICEDTRFLDEPLSGETDDPNNLNYTKKVYTKDQLGTYDMVREWRGVLDEYTGKDSNQRVMMIEAYANTSMTMMYYEYGAHFPFNFGLITDVNSGSSAADFKRLIDGWMSNMPPGATANWVAGNHDNSRLATRYGSDRAQAITLMTLLLPGVGVTYNGDEIGMVDTWISWEDTKDPQGCNAGKSSYEHLSRDPERSPFQWDNSTSAGFSTSSSTWLPVNENYLTLNLAAEKSQPDSFYALYQAVSKLKRSSAAVKTGDLTTKLLNDNVLAFSRETKRHGSVYAIINFGDQEETVDLTEFGKLPRRLRLYYATDITDHDIGRTVDDVSELRIPASGASIYVGTDTAEAQPMRPK